MESLHHHDDLQDNNHIAMGTLHVPGAASLPNDDHHENIRLLLTKESHLD